METLLWACRGLHLFAVVVWCGGLTYQAVIILPAVKMDESLESEETLGLLRRFMPFAWMSASTIAVTGLALMLFNPRFIFFQYRDAWSIVLGMKQLVFLLMAFFGFGLARMLAAAGRPHPGADEPAAGRALAVARVRQFHRSSVILAITGILLAAVLSSS